MYLKSIRAYGFKSFADKLDLEIKNGITAIVGPNGSGKSNIVDAVRWVLGEQSVKSLRGTDAMTDVIFSGSKTRDAHTRAMVALTFDNSDHYLNSDFEELEIKRVVYKTGENEYYINNTKVRLKDITNLFIDSGAGTESFNIISQGAVADIINSKPEARRTIFEEAAGVLKYKKRKEESLRKLDKTKENLTRVKLIIDELSTTVLPLKEQSEIAKKYLELKEELKGIEIALVASDITKINNEYTKLKVEIDELEEKVLGLSSANLEDSSNVEKLKLENIKIEEEINKKNSELLSVTENLANLASEKNLAVERKKFELDNDKIMNSLLALKEEELSLKKSMDILNLEITSQEQIINQKTAEKSGVASDLTTTKVKRSNIVNKINSLVKEWYEVKNQKEIIENNLLNDSRLPIAVKNILNNTRLYGVHNVIGKLIEVDKEYATAIDVALGYSANFVVVDDEDAAKNCIEYLKNNNLGRATFFPLNVIKSKFVDKGLIERLSQVDGFIGVASDLINFESKYSNIIENQLGNVLVVKDVNTLNLIGRISEHKYRIVSLDGEIAHTGGSITGGTIKNSSSVIKDRFEVEQLDLRLHTLKTNKEKLEIELKDVDSSISYLEARESEINKIVIAASEILNNKKTLLLENEKNYNQKIQDQKSMDAMKDNRLDDEIKVILEKYNEAIKEKEILEHEISELRAKKSDISNEINHQELKYRQANSEYNKLQNDLKHKEIMLGKYDVKLDSLLINLSENYSLTYEKACADYILELEEDVARLKINSLKTEINRLGDVNVGAIAEYDRLSKRYDFLTTQQSDLEEASSNLLAIIDEMDSIMIDKFRETFKLISDEFAVVFKKLFKGGKGELRLTNPDDLLTTGIEIVAEPPGKKLNSIVLLSGGEKTLTAIALLFAILNVKPVPFCILDEVEAALDEANVDVFGEYLEEKKANSQFILITHKKRTMEYADILYGITMQESGVSKIVSVKLENI